MAVTAGQKAAFLESMGQNKSLHYFMTGPNLGGDWSWSKALAGGYSGAELDEFIAKGKVAYSAHKSKDSSTPPPTPGDGPDPAGLGVACAKTAAKTITNAVSDLKQALLSTYSHLYPLQHVKVLGLKTIDDFPSMQKKLSALKTQIIEELGVDSAPAAEVAAGQAALRATNSMQAIAEYVDEFKKGVGPFDNLADLFEVMSTAQKGMSQHSQAVANAVGLLDELLSEMAEGGGQKLFTMLEGWRIEIIDQMNDLAWARLIEISDFVDGDGFFTVFSQSAEFYDIVSARAAIARIRGVIHDLADETGAVQAVDLVGSLKPTAMMMDARQAIEDIDKAVKLRMADLVSEKGWLGGDIIQEGAPITQYETFADFLQEVKLYESQTGFAQMMGLKSQQTSFSVGTVLEDVENAFNLAKAKAAQQVPGPSTSGFNFTADQIMEAGTDELNPAVQGLLEAQGETPSLVYFMSKAQKQDFLLDADQFALAQYEVKYKGQTLTGKGLDTAKQKYQAKTGSAAVTAPTPNVNKSGVSPVTGIAQDVTPPSGVGTTADVVEDLTEAKGPITGHGIGADPNAANWEDHPISPKQVFVINKHLSSKGLEGALDTDTLTKGEGSKLIGAIKGGKPMETADDIAVVLGQMENQTTPAQIKQAMKTFEEGPKVSGQAQQQVTSTAPKNISWDEPHSFTYVGDGQSIHGGAHRKWMFTDENGDQWMLKNGEDFRSEGELAAHKIGHLAGFDVAEARVTTQSTPTGRLKGFMQKMFRKDDIEGELKTLGFVNDSDLARLSADRLQQVQHHQVLDWLIGNHDYHSGNFLMLKDGRVAGIDKGQAFKWIGADRLDPDWIPPGNFADGAWTYQEMWKGYRRGAFDLDLNSVDEVLRRVESIDDDQLAEIVRTYAAGRFKASASQKFAQGLGEISNADELVAAVLARKRNIRKDFTEFYERMARERGETWKPGWGQAIDDVLPAPKPSVKAINLSDVLTPIDDEFAASVRSTGAAGKAVYVAGTEVERGQILIDQMDRPGGKTMRVHTYLRSDGDAKIMDIIRAEAPEAAQSAVAAQPAGPAVPSLVTKADSLQANSISGAKTINTHISSGDYKFNESTLAKLTTELEEIKGAKVTFTEGQLESAVETALGNIDVTGLDLEGITNAVLKNINDDLGAVVYKKAADLYKPHLLEITEQGLKGTSASKVALVPDFNATKEYQKLKNRAESLVQQKYVPGSVVETIEPEKVFDQVEFKRGFYTSLVKDKELSLDADFRGISSVDTNSNTYDLIVTLPSGKKAQILYHDHANSAVTNMGYFEMLVDVDEVSAAEIDNAMKFIRERLGISANLAKAEDMELTYWRSVVGNYRHSADAKDPSSRYFRALSEADQNLSQLGPNATARAEIDAIRGAFRNQFGEHVDDADYLPVHSHAHTGAEYGFGEFERPELTDADLSWVEDLWLGHRTSYHDGPVSAQQHMRFSATGNGFSGQQERKRAGIVASGASESSDMRSGGSSGFYNTFGVFSEVRNGNFVVWNPVRYHKRLGNYGQRGDQFGQLYDSASEAREAGVVGSVDVHRSGRSSGHHLDPKWWKDNFEGSHWNDVVVRNTASFVDEFEVAVVQSSAQRQQIIQRFKDAGLSQIRGVAIEDRVLLTSQVGTEAAFKAKMRDLTRRAGTRLRRSFDEAVGAGQTVARTTAQTVQTSLKRLKIKASPVTGTEFGGTLTKKLSTGRELNVRVRVAGVFQNPEARYHGVENAFSIKKEWLLTDDGKQWLDKLTSQTDILYANSGDRLVIDVSSLSLDVKTLTPYRRKRLYGQVLQAIDNESTAALVEQAALGVA